MESRLRIAGQAVQPVLVLLPIGLFAMAVFFDVARLGGAPDILGALAYWNLLAGLLAGVLVAVAGAVDLALQPGGTPGRRVGVLRNLMNMGMLALFAVIGVLRTRTPDRIAGGGLLILELLALAVGGFALWYGGELAQRRARVAPARPAGTRPLFAGRRAVD